MFTCCFGSSKSYNDISEVDPDSQYRSGLRYLKADKPTKAFECFQAAANANHAKAQFELANCYFLKRGTGQDEGKAKEWCEAAVKNGCGEKAQDFLKVLNAKPGSGSMVINIDPETGNMIVGFKSN